jgi:hypothetical protein
MLLFVMSYLICSQDHKAFRLVVIALQMLALRIRTMNGNVGSNNPDWARRYRTVNLMIVPENSTALFVPVQPAIPLSNTL